MPPDYAAEMVPFDPLVGEFRVHYAGFFDPGFGYAGAGGRGARAVLEVRSREVPFILEHGQIVGRLVYEKMLARPEVALRRGHRLELPGAGPQAVEAFPDVTAVQTVLPGAGALARRRSPYRKGHTLSRHAAKAGIPYPPASRRYRGTGDCAQCLLDSGSARCARSE